MGRGNEPWDLWNDSGEEAVRSRRVATLERDLPPLSAVGSVNDSEQDAVDPEVAEFVEYFTASRPEAPAGRARASSNERPHGRVRRATERLGKLAAARPEVRIPGARAKSDSKSRRRIKLPPVWVLANLAIVAALLVGFAPQIMSASAEAGCSWYTVRSGDTLWKISHHYGVSIQRIASANHIRNVDLIFIDQHLCIPMTPVASSAHTYSAPASSPPNYSAPSNVRTFVNYTLPYARRASAQTGWPVSVILAQWGLETGWRTHTYTGYNWGNVGAIPGMPTVGGINKPGSPAAFSYAYTPEQGLAEYVHVAHLSYYRGVASAAHTSADAAATALGRSPWDWGHYTNRGVPGSSLISLMRVYNLYWYNTH